MPDETPGFVSDPTRLLGRSVDDDLVAGYLRFHDALVPQWTYERGDAFYGAENSGFALVATTAISYRAEFGVSPAAGDSAGKFVKQICLSNENCASPGSLAYPHPLPLELSFGEPAEAVTTKLGVKPSAKQAPGTLPGHSPVASVWIYRRGEITWIVHLDTEHKLAAVFVLPLFGQQRRALERKASLKAESRNIDPANVDKVEALRASFPMPRWRETLSDGDDLFTERNISESEVLLNAYVDKVKAATERRSAAAIYAATRSLVTCLDKINKRDAYIETLERDELGVLINAIIAATGFKVADGEDITAGWRGW